MIDDLKESGINKAYTAVDSLALHVVDYVVSLALCETATIRRALKHPNRCVQIAMKDESILSGTLHKDIEAKQEWKGRCIDLLEAYKQELVVFGQPMLWNGGGRLLRRLPSPGACWDVCSGIAVF